MSVMLFLIIVNCCYVGLVENLRAKVKVWEEEKRMPFLYDKVKI